MKHVSIPAYMCRRAAIKNPSKTGVFTSWHDGHEGFGFIIILRAVLYGLVGLLFSLFLIFVFQAFTLFLLFPLMQSLALCSTPWRPALLLRVA